MLNTFHMDALIYFQMDAETAYMIPSNDVRRLTFKPFIEIL